MTADPRLRLLAGTSDGHLKKQVLNALNSTCVIVRTGSDMTGAHTSALAAFVGMAARLFGDVIMDPPVRLAENWWGAADTTALLTALAAVRPSLAEPAEHSISVVFGDRATPSDFCVGGDDYTVRLGRASQPLGANATHSFGLHAASCLTISQLLVEVLGPHGFPGVLVDESYVMNLLDYKLTPAPALASAPAATSLELAVAGVGSVGTSALALLATALSPALVGPEASNPRPSGIVTIDNDLIDPGRNPFRYPALLGTETGSKAEFFAGRLAELGLMARHAPVTVAEWVRGSGQPGFDGLLLSSVDTLVGRLDVTDVLARSTLSIGVAGLALHAQREAFADGLACPFCDYVSAAPPLTQAGVYAQTTGLTIQRVLALLQEGARLTEADVGVAIAAGKIPADRHLALIGAPLTDLVRQTYAELEMRALTEGAPSDDVLAVAAPQVSWFAGVLAAVEIVKQLLGLPLLDRRVDVDLGGLPPGLIRRVPADSTGRCLCRSGTRIKWYRRLYEGDATGAGSTPLGVS